MASKNAILSANWHMVGVCNYRCRFCFFHGVQEKLANLREAEAILCKIREMGIEKINLVGGEPTLHPHFMDICKMAKDQGLVVGITTNGSTLSLEVLDSLKAYVNWIGVSIDSASEDVEFALGRGFGSHVMNCKRVCRLIKERGIRLKINSTVTSLNWAEDLKPLIEELGPERWKNFQVLHIKGQNDAGIEQLGIGEDLFRSYVALNKDIVLPGGHEPIFESCDDMLGSYLMISPLGNIIANKGGSYVLERSFSQEIISYQKNINVEKYLRRGGVYDW